MKLLNNFGIFASAGSLSPFSYEAEAQTFFAAALAAGVEPSTARKRTYNRLVKRLKNYGVWSKLTHLWLLAADNETIAKINVKNPGVNDLTKNGTPTFTQNDGVNCTAGDTGNYYDTGVALNSISQDNHCFGLYFKTFVSHASSDFGAVDGSLNGIGINPYATATSAVTARSMSASSNIGTSVYTNGKGFYSINRSSSTTVNADKSGYRFVSPSITSIANSSSNTLHILRINNPGSTGSGRKISTVFLASSLTELELRRLYACIEQYQESVLYGEFYEEEKGIGTQNITADVIIYGATSSAITAAYEVARNGKTVAICGGWRDRRVGGMSSGGLGFTDFDNHASLGGLPRWIITKMNSIYSRADTTFLFEPRIFTRAVNFLLDSTKNGGYNIPIYYTNGVTSVNKTGTDITSIRTSDGRIFTGSRFIDCSYEGDLIKAAGVTVTKGREAAGSSAEGLNGFRGILTTDNSNGHQFKVGGVLKNVDPYIIAGDSNSGLLSGVSRTYGVDTPALGTADSEIQAYNFRLILTTDAAYKIPFPSTPPTGYSAADFEPLGRLMQAEPTVTIAELLKIDSLSASSAWDINSQNGWSTDWWGGSKLYPESSYAARETIWKNHWNHILGLFYYLQYDSDSRVTSGVRTSALTYGFHNLHYPDHHENDDVFVSPQLYVRECYRMVSDFILNANDIEVTDGTTPRSTKTISTASYAMDSHSTEALADPNGGTPRIWISGNFLRSLTGNQTAPVPYDITVPKASECTNLLATFAISSTHAAFGSVRMEFTAMQTGQSVGLAAVQSINDGVTVQNVNYTNLRTALLASATLSGEVAPVLPQLN